MVATRSRQTPLSPGLSLNSTPSRSRNNSTRTSPRKGTPAAGKSSLFEVINSDDTPTTRSTRKTNGVGLDGSAAATKVNGAHKRVDDDGEEEVGRDIDEDKDNGGVALPNGVEAESMNGHVEEEEKEDEVEDEILVNAKVNGEGKADEEDAEKTAEVNGKKNGFVPDSEEEDEESEDEAPEVISMSTGRELTKAKEEEAKKAIQKQEDAVRQKRRERDAQLKEQKAQALKRKQVTESELEEGQHEKKKLKTANEDTTPKTNGVEEHWEKPALPSEYKLQQLQQLHQNAFDDHHAEDDERNTTPTSTTLSAAPATYSVPPPPRRSKIPLLLPDSLLEEVASRGSPPPSLVLPKIHKKAADFEYEETNGSLSLSNSKRERKQTYIKKGPISVAVLDPAQTHSRKSMAPKAIAGVKNVKNAWMFKGKGNHIEREKPRTGFGTSVGGFFKRGF